MIKFSAVVYCTNSEGASVAYRMAIVVGRERSGGYAGTEYEVDGQGVTPDAFRDMMTLARLAMDADRK